MAATRNAAFAAAEIALVAIKQNRKSTWSELVSSGIDTRLSAEQLELVNRNLHVVEQLQVSTGAHVTVTWCPECDKIAFLAQGSPPAKCTLTLRCPGSPVKAGAQRRAGAA
ncbi:hypothetical protein ACFVAJ_16450 [Agromyces sp. NPDC057679]|uniref:hypothetical protein n=1 Tax=Agromyces sp. NPDC057679 TaxID=3346207 RepID=UPI00366D3F97